MPEQIFNCVIWPDFKATAYGKAIDPETGENGLAVESERSGGKYGIYGAAIFELGDVDARVKARLTTWLIDQRLQGAERPLVTPEIINYASTKRPLLPDERAERLLMYFVKQSDSLDTKVHLSHDLLMAVTESMDLSEAIFLWRHLSRRGWIDTQVQHPRNTLPGIVTMEGYERLTDTATTPDSAQAFVAMWFDQSMDAAFTDGIAPAVRDAGYVPYRIDREEHLNKIDDEIIAQIRRSRFLIADFTQQGDKARGGVYYEAGFAHGLNLKVIFTCHEASLEKVHLDTRQYRHIEWTTPEDLRGKLRNTILANIGEGPELRKTE